MQFKAFKIICEGVSKEASLYEIIAKTVELDTYSVKVPYQNIFTNRKYVFLVQMSFHFGAKTHQHIPKQDEKSPRSV